ncbi:glycosyltransferase family 2 protein [Breoghania sp. L-A4]|uniref:glycosyltransferase family 2 protein n=1 Tax=Breoghania sp. L-A4 TaxID=2304600 RepID=UPI000E35E6BB|nr:glycosyltransferase family 2 protein [Breoghania sp. L-A4]AXS39626.1 glycosyltransferase [Breoghania sp. L-A4]
MKRKSRDDGLAKSPAVASPQESVLAPTEALRRRLAMRRSVLNRKYPNSPGLLAEPVNGATPSVRRASTLPLDVRFLVARGLPRRDAIRATDVAARSGRAPGEVLLAERCLAAETYYRWLAEELRVRYVEISDLVPDPRGKGYLPNVEEGRLAVLAVEHAGPEIHAALAPGPACVAEVIVYVARHPQVRSRVSVTTPQALESVRVCQGAVQALQAERPLASAAFLFTRAQKLAIGGAAAGAGCIGWLDAAAGLNALSVASGSLFIAAGAARTIAAAAAPRPASRLPLPRQPSSALPRYSVLVPLYREEAVIGDLVQVLRRLDYPAERLQIVMIVEADDFGTHAALHAAGLRPPFEVCVVPPFGPRTKPKALAHALTCAHGDLITVYDAEDRPEPDQLRKAAATFAAAPSDLGCLQARLAVDHADESFFTRHFALEYALQFDVLLPWMAALHLPVRLGGTSNHVRADALRACGGWDPYNVTEDLDLGIRLIRSGWRVGFLDSTTWEEAPLDLRAWCHQRIRWHKGWLQTWVVHMRQPVHFIKNAGAVNAVVIAGIFAGTLLTLAAHPTFLMLVGLYAGDGAWRPSSDGIIGDLVLGIGLTCIVLGYGGFYLAIRRAARERALRFGWREMAGLPFYWLLMSAALAIAAAELVIRPCHWRKTTHGVAKTRPASHPPDPARRVPRVPVRARLLRRLGRIRGWLVPW